MSHHTSHPTRWGIVLAFFAVLSGQLPAAALGADYRLRDGDAVSVSVLGHPDLSVQAQPIRPGGQISMPLIQALSAQGKTVSELTDELTGAYRPFLNKPQISVTVAKFRPMRVTILGQVGRPGTFDFEEAPTLVDVLATAGGLSERAARNSIKVVGPAGSGKTYDLDRLLSRQESNPLIQEGSIVEVGEVWGPDLYRVTIPLLAAFVSSAVWLLRP
ncbi:MAG TPA: polysaccharide biosynthesis/export family protein [Pantanalinema sp.]